MIVSSRQSVKKGSRSGFLLRSGLLRNDAFARHLLDCLIQNPPEKTMLLFCVLADLGRHCNKSDGGTHPSDRNRIKEAFLRLSSHGVILEKSEVMIWLEAQGWARKHAVKIAGIAQDIGDGKKVVIKDGPYYDDDFIKQWQDAISATLAAGKGL